MYTVLIKNNNTTEIYKFLSKVIERTNISRTTLTKHNTYENKEFIVYKASFVDLKSNNKGNINNLSL